MTNSTMFYPPKALEYFLAPEHAGIMEYPDGVGLLGDSNCGDSCLIMLRVKDEVIEEIRYQVFGCPAAIATCEAVAVMGEGRTLEQAATITDGMVDEHVGGLPEEKQHCSNFAAEALGNAIADYRARQARRGPNEGWKHNGDSST